MSGASRAAQQDAYNRSCALRRGAAGLVEQNTGPINVEAREKGPEWTNPVKSKRSHGASLSCGPCAQPSRHAGLFRNASNSRKGDGCQNVFLKGRKSISCVRPRRWRWMLPIVSAIFLFFFCLLFYFCCIDARGRPSSPRSLNLCKSTDAGDDRNRWRHRPTNMRGPCGWPGAAVFARQCSARSVA